MSLSHEEVKSKIEQMIAEIDRNIEDARNVIMNQLEIGFMTPELLEKFVELFGDLITLMDSRRNLVEYAKFLEIDIQ